VPGSSYWAGGDGVDEDEDQHDEGDADVAGEADADRVYGTVSVPVDGGTTTEGLVRS
jgi:hypothetical protein